MARYALAVGSKETPPFIRMAAVRPAVVVSPLAAQHFLNFFPLPHGHGSFRPTVIFRSFGNLQLTDHGTIIFTPDAGYDGEASFSYLISDPQGLVFGAETSGLPASVRDAIPAGQQVRLPIRPGQRSLNLSNAVAVAVFEAWRQNGYAGGS